MKIAFLFPGQGAQTVGMCKDIYDKYEEARTLYEKASEVLGIDIEKLCFSGPEEELNKTKNTQLAILVTSLAICKVLKKYGIEPDICAGLSLGEYTALIESVILSFKDGLNLVKFRGQVMEKESSDEYMMAAIIGLDSKAIENVCNSIDGFIVPANYNYSSQTVVTGKRDVINHAVDIFKEKGAKRVIPLNTSGPFHTEKLENASNKLKNELAKIKFYDGNSKVLKNIDATEYDKNSDFVQILSKHMVNPVRMDKIIKKLEKENVELYVEVGPGKALGGFVKKELKDAKVISVNDLKSLDSLIEIVKECK